MGCNDIQEQKTKRAKELLFLLSESKRKNLCYFYKPYTWQKKALEIIRNKKIVVIPAPNKIGKTGLLVNVGISWLLGYEPWNKIPKEYFHLYEEKDKIKVKDDYYITSSLEIKPPVILRMTGKDWLHHVGKTLIPELKKWAPETQYETKKNNQGIDYSWTFNNKSTLEIMTYDQEDELYESWMGHGWLGDEPPPRSKYTGMSRGLFLTGGKAVLTMTPLKEAWILDELILNAERTDIGVVDGLTVLDNEDLYKHDADILKEAGLSNDMITEYFKFLLESIKTEKADRFLSRIASPANYIKAQSKLHFVRFLQDIPEDEKDARIFGRFKHLSGLILKEFNKDKHRIPPFKIPPDWPVTAMIDIHLRKPQAVGFYATDKREQSYAIGEIWQNLSPEELANEIIRMKKAYGWNLEHAYIDPLSKGDDSYMRNRIMDAEDTYTILEEKLAEFDIELDIASKDKKSGILNIKNWLCGVNKMPSLFFFDTCKRHLFEIQRWVYDENEVPIKENDDFMENLYRYTLTGTKYKEQTKELFPVFPYDNHELSWMGT